MNKTFTREGAYIYLTMCIVIQEGLKDLFLCTFLYEYDEWTDAD